MLNTRFLFACTLLLTDIVAGSTLPQPPRKQRPAVAKARRCRSRTWAKAHFDVSERIMA